MTSNPSLIPLYYKPRTQDAANAFAMAYDQGNLLGAGIATGQTLYDISNAAAMHITDGKGNVYDKNLNNLTAKFKKENPGWHENKIKEAVKKLPEAHIKVREFVGLSLRPDNV